MTGARVHLCRLSSAAGVRLLRAAKAEGLKVTADVSINSLHLTDHDGWRITCFATNTRGPGWTLAALEIRHRLRARAEDRIRALKDTGLRNLPCRGFAENAAWLEAVLTATDLVCWTQLLGFHDTPDLARCEIATFRYRVLHVAGPERDEPARDLAPVALGDPVHGPFRTRDVVVGDDDHLEEVPGRRDLGDRISDPTGTDEKYPHTATVSVLFRAVDRRIAPL